MSEVFEKQFLACGENPDGMECWKCSHEQEAYCDLMFRTVLTSNSKNEIKKEKL